MFDKIYKLFNFQGRNNIQEFPIELIRKVEICITNPEKYKTYFLNITQLIQQKFESINSNENDRLATSFMRGIAESTKHVNETIAQYFKIGSCGIYDQDLYIVKEINYGNGSYFTQPTITIKKLKWGKEEDLFDVEEQTLLFSNFIFSKEDIELNLLMLPNVNIEELFEEHKEG